MYRTTIKQRGQFLATASATALILSMWGTTSVAAGYKPPLWLELGWQYESVGVLGDPFVPPVTSALTAAGFASPTSLQRRMGYGYGGEAGISFQPNGSDWILSASIRYGRAHGLAKVHEQTVPATAMLSAYVTRAGVVIGHLPGQVVRPREPKVEDTHVSNDETHAIIDFQAGKDVGLGIGTQSASQLNFGLRFAQFHSRSAVAIAADADSHFEVVHFTAPIGQGEYFHRNQPFPYFHYVKSTGNEDRRFEGLGPSISWNAAAALAGNPQDGELDLDWGVNAAILFGQQKTRILHKTASKKFDGENFYGTPGVYTIYGPAERSKRVTVPNAGAFAGISFRYIDAELKFGYRADLFFNAIDGGINARHETMRSFCGPFASINIGLGGSSD